MRKLFSSIIPLLGMALVMTGCAGPEQKLGRGINNLTEITRLGELRRSVEQTTVLVSRDQGYTTGVFHGIDRTFARTAVGLYEVATFPFPNHSPKNYGPIFKPENPVNPDSYKPNWYSDQMTSPDTSLGFGGGDMAPFIPGSRFHVFDQ
ncbi:MAG: exosortase system-associated protein, TIGR04073 family [Verrucomicrobiota bacterium]|jgi:putative exosortase-associated protein (TIGR04073 family)